MLHFRLLLVTIHDVAGASDICGAGSACCVLGLLVLLFGHLFLVSKFISCLQIFDRLFMFLAISKI